MEESLESPDCSFSHRIQPPIQLNMKRFLIVDDHSSAGKAIWDNFIYEVLPNLKNRPKIWAEKYPNIPEGQWEVSNAMNAMMPPASAYENFGVRVPTFEEMPMIFVVNPDNSVEEQCNVTVELLTDFINARI